jgi:ferric iron reductase protein FhuF
VDPAPQERVVAALAPAARYGLIPPPASVGLPVRELTDRDRLADVVAAHAEAYPGAPRGVVLTLWWYLASAVLTGPTAAGALVGVPLSGAIDDLELHVGAASMPAAAVARALGPDDAGPALGATLGELIDTACATGRVRPRPLWAVAADSLANRLLTFGRARGEVDHAIDLARDLLSSSGAPVPTPRFTCVAGARFLVRTSCCLLYRATAELCTSCPQRPAGERLKLLTRVAPDFR